MKQNSEKEIHDVISGNNNRIVQGLLFRVQRIDRSKQNREHLLNFCKLYVAHEKNWSIRFCGLRKFDPPHKIHNFIFHLSPQQQHFFTTKNKKSTTPTTMRRQQNTNQKYQPQDFPSTDSRQASSHGSVLSPKNNVNVGGTKSLEQLLLETTCNKTSSPQKEQQNQQQSPATKTSSQRTVTKQRNENGTVFIGGYEIEDRVLGHGDYSKVVLGFCAKKNKQYAIKVLKPNLLKMKKEYVSNGSGGMVVKTAWDQVENEVGIMKLFDHVNVVRV